VGGDKQVDTVIRVVIIYIFIVIGLRVVGKREFGQLSPLELVTLLIIPELVSQALTHEDYSLTNAIVGTTTLIVLVYLSSVLQFRVKPFERAINGTPTVLVRHGTYIARHMNEERIAPEEIFNAMHESGLERLEQVRWAILETDGKISIVSEEQTASSGNQGKQTKAAAV
jgi:uncharacterized membrane protein YcaP (DUF421 family)